MYETGYCEASAMGSMMIGLGGLFVLLILILALFNVSKSKRYRKTLADLYVAGKIKQIAGKENINLTEEFKAFRQYVKKFKIDVEALDNTIERELQEKVEENVDKNIDLK